MSGNNASLRVVTSRSVAQFKRLPRMVNSATSTDVRAVKWRASARTDDGLTILLTVNLSEELVTKIVGAHVADTDEYVILTVFGHADSTSAPRALLSTYVEFCIDLDRPLNDRELRSS